MGQSLDDVFKPRKRGCPCVTRGQPFVVQTFLRDFICQPVVEQQWLSRATCSGILALNLYGCASIVEDED